MLIWRGLDLRSVFYSLISHWHEDSFGIRKPLILTLIHMRFNTKELYHMSPLHSLTSHALARIATCNLRYPTFAHLLLHPYLPPSSTPPPCLIPPPAHTPSTTEHPPPRPTTSTHPYNNQAYLLLARHHAHRLEPRERSQASRRPLQGLRDQSQRSAAQRARRHHRSR